MDYDDNNDLDDSAEESEEIEKITPKKASSKSKDSKACLVRRKIEDILEKKRILEEQGEFEDLEYADGF